ncbi:hypothetical protein BDZ89DRAFT_1065316 [Hymenopellis radicata]|nr:hypothetical protein BDZ89DRAFT_1065316 [Hymenopellis radicata]
MDNASQKLLESATHRTLHATGFARSSSQASLVLTDLLSRYLTLLTSTCAKYAQHGGRTRLSSRDAISALDEMGVSLDELKDFGLTEGLELNRYAIKSSRRAEDLNEFRAQLSEGLKQDLDDAIPLHYAPFEGIEEQDEEDDYEDDHMSVDDEVPSAETRMDEDDMYADIDVPMGETRVRPILPLSPISNPSSPSRKRLRTLDWQPPPHIPEFLPPFPSMDAPPPAELPEPIIPVPYHQSSLASQPEFHLPTPLPDPPERVQKLPTPNIEQSLISAYHHILTHRQPSNSATGTSNPLRHKVAMSLLALTQSSSRWEPADTLYSNLATNQPRVTAMGPSHPSVEAHGRGSQLTKDKDYKFPNVNARTLYVNDRLSNVVSQQSSRIPELAQQVLPTKIYSRASRITHPPVLVADNNALTYGPGIPAPWNTGNSTASGDGKKEDAPPVLPDARLFATWDSETKNFREPLKGRGNRGKVVIHPTRRGSRLV